MTVEGQEVLIAHQALDNLVMVVGTGYLCETFWWMSLAWTIRAGEKVMVATDVLLVADWWRNSTVLMWPQPLVMHFEWCNPTVVRHWRAVRLQCCGPRDGGTPKQLSWCEAKCGDVCVCGSLL